MDPRAVKYQPLHTEVDLWKRLAEERQKTIEDLTTVLTKTLEDWKITIKAKYELELQLADQRIAMFKRDSKLCVTVGAEEGGMAEEVGTGCVESQCAQVTNTCTD